MTRRSSLIAEVRRTTAAVASRATSVRIREDGLRHYRSTTKQRHSQISADPTQTYVGPSEARARFVLLRDATNFGSGYHPFVEKIPGLSGARTLGTHLAAHVRSDGVPGSEWMLSATAEQCAAIFRQELAGPVGELMALFASAWNELGQHLHTHYQDNAIALIEEARHSAVSLVGLLAEMSFFQDRALYHDLEVHFYKRAQLTAFDLATALGGGGLGRFDDLHELTTFIDNLIPHVLRLDGVLEFDRGLTDHIARGSLIPSGSAAEVEIRACALHAVHELSQLCVEAGDSATELELGDWLWNRGRARSTRRCPDTGPGVSSTSPFVGFI